MWVGEASHRDLHLRDFQKLCLPFSRCLQYLVWIHMSYILTLQGFVFSADRMQWANKGGGG